MRNSRHSLGCGERRPAPNSATTRRRGDSTHAGASRRRRTSRHSQGSPGYRLPLVALVRQWRQDYPDDRPPTWATTAISAVGQVLPSPFAGEMIVQLSDCRRQRKYAQCVRTDPADPLACRGREVALGRGVGHHQSVTKQLIGSGIIPITLPTGVLWRIAQAN
jgi:hypothetical protein